MSDDLAEKVAAVLGARLRLVHFDGNGCGTHGSNACSICHGPSPMSADEVGREAAAALVPLIREREAVAWDEGYGAGSDDESDAYWGPDHPDTPNPYRAALDGEGA